MEHHPPSRIGVTPFSIPVMGGSFRVSAVVPREDRSADEMVQAIRRTPADRWFVMLSEDDDAASGDSLALIDESFEFQVYAVGTFDGDD